MRESRYFLRYRIPHAAYRKLVIPFNCIAHPFCASFFAGLARARARARSELYRPAQLFSGRFSGSMVAFSQTNSVTSLFYSIYLSKIRLYMIYSNLKIFSLFNFEIFRLIHYLQSDFRRLTGTVQTLGLPIISLVSFLQQF